MRFQNTVDKLHKGAQVMTSAGNRHHVLRTVSHHKGLFLFALFDKQRTNLALARFKLMEAEQGLL